MTASDPRADVIQQALYRIIRQKARFAKPGDIQLAHISDNEIKFNLPSTVAMLFAEGAGAQVTLAAGEDYFEKQAGQMGNRQSLFLFIEQELGLRFAWHYLGAVSERDTKFTAVIHNGRKPCILNPDCMERSGELSAITEAMPDMGEAFYRAAALYLSHHPDMPDRS